MRGTCSGQFQLLVRRLGRTDPAERFRRDRRQVDAGHLPILWSAIWYGIATNALSRAQSFVRAEARRSPNQTPPGAARRGSGFLLQLMRSNTSAAITPSSMRCGPRTTSASVGFIVSMNNVKIGASRMAIDVINQALMITGIKRLSQQHAVQRGPASSRRLVCAYHDFERSHFRQRLNLLLMHRLDPKLAA